MKVKIGGFEGELLSLDAYVDYKDRVEAYKVVMQNESRDSRITFEKVKENNIEIRQEVDENIEYETSNGTYEIPKRKNLTEEDLKYLLDLVSQAFNAGTYYIDNYTIEKTTYDIIKPENINKTPKIGTKITIIQE